MTSSLFPQIQLFVDVFGGFFTRPLSHYNRSTIKKKGDQKEKKKGFKNNQEYLKEEEREEEL